MKKNIPAKGGTALGGQRKIFVISLGGSLIVPEKIDVSFLKRYKAVILKQIEKNSSFIIITGGGKTCRKYQKALTKISKPNEKTLDWLGIYSTRLNARLIQMIFGKLSATEIVENPAKKIKFGKILIASGYKPGRSTDYVATALAKKYGARTVINLSNVSYVYDKDPKKFKNAQKQKRLSWNELLKITGRKWTPGKNVPFDPTAAKFAKKNKLKVIVTNGKDLKNLRSILEGKKFNGTVIE